MQPQTSYYFTETWWQHWTCSSNGNSRTESEKEKRNSPGIHQVFTAESLHHHQGSEQLQWRSLCIQLISTFVYPWTEECKCISMWFLTLTYSKFNSSLICLPIKLNCKQGRMHAVLGIKVEIERLVISIPIHSIWVANSGTPVSFSYVMIQDAAVELWPLAHLLVAVTSSSEQPGVRSKLVLWLLLHWTQCIVYVIQ